MAFDSLMYSFFENEGTVQVSVRLSRNISQPLTVRVEGGELQQHVSFYNTCIIIYQCLVYVFFLINFPFVFYCALIQDLLIRV